MESLESKRESQGTGKTNSNQSHQTKPSHELPLYELVTRPVELFISLFLPLHSALLFHSKKLQSDLHRYHDFLFNTIDICKVYILYSPCHNQTYSVLTLQ